MKLVYSLTPKFSLLFYFFCFFPAFISAQSSDIWSFVEESTIEQKGKRYIIPKVYQTVSLEVDKMKLALDKAPLTGTDAVRRSPAYVDIPWPDGTIKSFQIIETPIMESPLLENFPEIKTYTGSAVQDPSLYIRLDFTPKGFHAMVLTADKGTVYIDPYYFKGDIEHYLVYYKKDFAPIAGKTMVCGVDGQAVNTADFRPGSGTNRFGSCELRTYRLALAATGEYTQFHGGTVAGALSAQVTTMNRVNGVYNRDLAIQMNIIGNNNLIIYTNGGTDPYTNNNGATMLNENQNNVNSVIGSANYDIGHVFSTGGGGIAQLYSPCSNNSKAKGVTGSFAPVGDPFDIDYVCHEMGHQFGGNHTQNNNCQRNTGVTSVEPGSASTIMGYAGICNPNVQNNSDDHFHGITLQEIGNFVTSGGHNCPVKTPLSNTAPTVTGTNAAGVTVPGTTPFALTATATDPDANTLTYCWEQMDADVSTQPPSATSTVGPNFRSNSPSTNSTRYFPNLPDVLAGNSPTWEVLSTVSRTMDFRVSVRDNAAGGGCTDNNDVTITIDGNSGPFLVLNPSNTGISWAGNSTETVTWDVSGTDVSPVACANVDILLSTDGGATYPTVLASNVPNDGSHPVTVPNVGTTTARVMVICANGTFFDVSNNNFTITLATCTVSSTVTSNVSCNGGSDAVATATATGVSPYSYSWTGGQNTNPAIGLSAGIYTVTLTDNTGCTATATTVITEPSTALTVVSSSTDETCIGSDGSVSANASGGTGTLQYLWSSGQATASVLGLAAGSYSVTVTDANGCNTVSSAVVTNSCCGLSLSATGSALTCNAATNGTATVSPTGAGGYTYSWTGGQNTATAIGLAAGIYTVTVTDITPCTATETVTITEPSAITVVTAASSESCATNDGTASLTVSGGTGGFNYAWDAAASAQTASLATALIQGTYSYTVTDANACSSIGSVNVPNGCVANTCDTITNIDPADNLIVYNSGNGYVAGHNQYGDVAKAEYYNYAGTNTHIQGAYYYFGAATASNTTNTFNLNIWDGTGGTPGAIIAQTSLTYSALATAGTPGLYYIPFNYTAIPATGEFFVGISFSYAAGDTIALVTNTDPETTPATAWEQWSDNSWHSYDDASGWGLNISHDVSPVLGILPTANFTQSSPTTCSGGALNFTNTSTNGFSYEWIFAGGTPATSSSANPSVSYNTSGIFDVTLIATNDCMVDTITVAAAVTVTDLAVAATTNPESCSTNDGSATLAPSGGLAPYSYLWSNGQTTASISGLSAAGYAYTVSSSNGCVTSGTVNVADGCVPCTLLATATATNVNCQGVADGTATANPSNGSPAYAYQWSGGQTVSAINGLAAGIYVVTITDAATCTATASVTITEPASAISASATASGESCVGNDGTASLTASGGTGSLTYLWSDGQNTALATGLNTGNYAYTISDANGCVLTGTITVPTICLTGCDTITNIQPTDNLTIYNDGATGYVAGHNQYGDLAKADFYSYTGANTHIQGAYLYFGVAVASNTTNTFNVHVWDGTGGTPGSILVTTTLTYDALTTGGTPGVYYVPFDYTALPASKEFFVGIEFAYAAGDTVALVTNTDPETTPSTAWEQWGDLTWHTYDGPGGWGLAITHNISPVLGVLPTASFTQSNAAVCEGGTITYTNTTTLAQDYQWSFPGGTPATSTATNPTVTYASAGTYDVALIAINDCMADTLTLTNTVVVTNIIATASSTSVSCNGGSDGTATASGSGGSGAYTYAWSDGQSTATAVGLTAAIYTVTLTDANGCTASTTTTITAPNALLISASSTNTTCAGSDGTAVANVSGGIGGYSYAWSSGQSTASIAALGVNNYSLTVTDVNGCTASTTISVVDGCICTIVAAATANNQVSCNGGNDAQATVVQTQGTAPFSYSWSDGQSTATAVGLAAAVYTVTVTDANSCTASSSVTITEPSILVASATSVAESCTGNDGTITAAVTGGTGAYFYNWSSGQTTASLTGLSAAIYSLTVTDANGCTTSTSVAVIDGCACPIVVAATVNNPVSCNGGNDGSATANQTLGVAPISYLWTGGQTNATATGLLAGIYNVTVTDNNGCAANASVTITAPSAVLISLSSTNTTCAGNDGTAVANISGGTAGYSYTWSNSQSTASIAGLAVGTYGLTVTDANSCTASTTVSIADGCVCTMVAAATVNNQVSCNGGSDAQATVTQTQGTAPISYSWSDGQNTALAVGLAAAVYTVTVTDVNGCTASSSVTITEPISALSALVTGVSNPLCNNDNNGSITVNAFGGNPNYTFDLGNGPQSVGIFTSLSATTYTVTVTDANGCTTTLSSGLSNPAPISTSASISNAIACNGGSDGAATASAFGGTGGFAYVWSNGQTSATATGLSATVYSITASDVNGCSANTTITLTDPAAIVLTATQSTGISCAGSVDGIATANASGGAGVFTYLWNNGQATASSSGLSVGSYSVTATDQNGCFAVETILMTAPAAIVLNGNISSNYNGSSISCNGAADAAASVVATGGSGVYTYQWTPGGQSTPSATGLGANVYNIQVVDANNCSAVTAITITEPATVNASAVLNNSVGCFGAADATATASGTGGTGSFSYLWSNGQGSATSTGLSAQVYAVSVTDQNGCLDQAGLTITEPSAINVSAVDNGDGTATVSSLGGTGTYTYLWDVAASSQTTATATGLVHNNTYTVTVSDQNGCTATASVTVNITGLNNVPGLAQFDVIPNPSDGSFAIQISFLQAKESTIRLTNVLGQLLAEYKYEVASFTIPVDISQQASGVYFVVLNTTNKSVTRKVVVSK
jgi:hypothetical protein